jgi:hypothetical protein
VLRVELIVGYYPDNTTTHGFLYNPNSLTYTTLDDPAATAGTFATGINDAGQTTCPDRFRRE